MEYRDLKKIKTNELNELKLKDLVNTNKKSAVDVTTTDKQISF